MSEVFWKQCLAAAVALVAAACFTAPASAQVDPVGNEFLGAIDGNGVALAAIQGLHELVQERDVEIDTLTSRIAELERLVERLAEQQQEDTP